MSKSDIDYIRKYKVPIAKIGQGVTYAGHPYRIAWTRDGLLVLRSELLVHPQDQRLDYDPPLSTNEGSNEREITRLRSMLYEMTSLTDWLQAGYTIDQYNATVGDFIKQDERFGLRSKDSE